MHTPPQGAKHCLLVDEGRLHLVIAYNETSEGAQFHHIIFEEADLDVTFEQTMSEVDVLLLAAAAEAAEGAGEA
jgi:hypothetical protein